MRLHLTALIAATALCAALAPLTLSADDVGDAPVALSQAVGESVGVLPPPPGIALPRLGPLSEEKSAEASTSDGLMFFDDVFGDNGTIVPLADQYDVLCNEQVYSWQLMPQGLIYKSYLAGAKESRFRGVWTHDPGEGDIWDISLGGNVGIIRYGTRGDVRPEGVQLGIEGAGLTRLNQDHNLDVDATDYRFGIPLTWGDAFRQTKFAFYHLSSHVGDEFLLRNPGFNRLNYSRNVLVLGRSIYLRPNFRIYGEAGYGFDADVCEPWEFQFGFDYAPMYSTGARGAPFIAANGHLREEVDFGGNGVFQVGWAWRRSPASGLLRTGVEYYNGKNDQFSFFNDSEQKFGYAIWYDY